MAAQPLAEAGQDPTTHATRHFMGVDLRTLIESGQMTRPHWWSDTYTELVAYQAVPTDPTKLTHNDPESRIVLNVAIRLDIVPYEILQRAKEGATTAQVMGFHSIENYLQWLDTDASAVLAPYARYNIEHGTATPAPSLYTHMIALLYIEQAARPAPALSDGISAIVTHLVRSGDVQALAELDGLTTESSNAREFVTSGTHPERHETLHAVCSDVAKAMVVRLATARRLMSAFPDRTAGRSNVRIAGLSTTSWVIALSVVDQYTDRRAKGEYGMFPSAGPLGFTPGEPSVGTLSDEARSAPAEYANPMNWDDGDGPEVMYHYDTDE